MCVYRCEWVLMWRRECAHSQEARRQSQLSFLWRCPPYFLKQDLSLAWDSLIRLGWWSSKPQALDYVHFSSPGTSPLLDYRCEITTPGFWIWAYHTRLLDMRSPHLVSRSKVTTPDFQMWGHHSWLTDMRSPHPAYRYEVTTLCF